MLPRRFEVRRKSFLAAFCALAIALSGGTTTAPAQTPTLKYSRCPSKDYYIARANNPLEGTPSRLDYVVCVLISTANRQIDLKTQVIVEATSAKALQDRLASELVGRDQCGVGNLGGWEIRELTLQFRRTGGYSRIRVAARARECSWLGAIPGFRNVTYEVPLDHTFEDGTLTFQIRREEAVGTMAGVENTLVADRLSDALGTEVRRINFDVNSYLPRFVRSLGPTLDRADLALTGDRVSLKLSGAAKLTGPGGDRILSEATKGLNIEQVLQLIRSKGPLS